VRSESVDGLLALESLKLIIPGDKPPNVDKEPGTSVLHSEPHEMMQIDPAINAKTKRQEYHTWLERSGAEDFPIRVLGREASLQFPSICVEKRSYHRKQ
jgi:hypothetical protein